MTDPKALPVRVKHLRWDAPKDWENSMARYPDGTLREWRSVHGPFAYFIHRDPITDSFRCVFGNTQFWLGNWGALEAAKAAAQADYEARIVSAIEVVEDDVLERAWMAGRDAAVGVGGHSMNFCDRMEPDKDGVWLHRDDIEELTPPADLRAALTKGSTDDRT